MPTSKAKGGYAKPCGRQLVRILVSATDELKALRTRPYTRTTPSDRAAITNMERTATAMTGQPPPAVTRLPGR
jgi:hypothetical protein